MAIGATKPSLREALTIIFRNRRAIAYSFLIPPILALALAFVLTKYYQADSKILVKTGREFIPDDPDASHATMGSPATTMQETINSEIEILTSRDLISDVISQVGIYNVFPDMSPDHFSIGMLVGNVRNFVTKKVSALFNLPVDDASPDEKAFEQFQEQLTIEPVKLANVLSVSFRNASRDVAKNVLQRLVDGYMKRHVEAFSSPKSQLLQMQLDDNLKTLQKVGATRAALKSTHGLYSVNEQRTALISRRDTAIAELAENESKQRQDQKLNAFLTHRLKALPSNGAIQTTADSTGRGAALTQLLSLRQAEQQLLQKYTPQNPLVIDVETAIKATQKFIEGSADAPPPIGDELKMQEVNTEGELTTLAPLIDDLKNVIHTTTNQLQQLESDAVTLNELDLEVSNLEQKNSSLRDALNQSRISESLDRGQVASVSLIEAPHVESKPVRPKKILFLLGGIMLGMIVAGYTVLASVTYGNTFVTVEGIERILGLPVLATIPMLQPQQL
jgi:uncharacterized protein involved in exopolysaccharide biosynthesis